MSSAGGDAIASTSSTSSTSYAEASVASVPVPVTTANLDNARAVSEAVYRAAAAPPPVSRLDQGVVTLTAVGPNPAPSALSAVARDIIKLFATADGRQLRECASPECGLLFLDLSRLGRNRWCSSTAYDGKARAAVYRQRRVRPPS